MMSVGAVGAGAWSGAGWWWEQRRRLLFLAEKRVRTQYRGGGITALSSFQGADQRLHTGAIARFLVGNSPFLCLYVIQRPHRQPAAEGSTAAAGALGSRVPRWPPPVLCGRPWAAR